jgi:hypothetical protein
MNAFGGRNTLPAIVALIAAMSIAVSWFLPWETVLINLSLIDIIGLSNRFSLGDLLIIGAPVIAGIAAFWRLMNVNSGRMASAVAAVSFGIALAACGLTIVIWPQSADAKFGAQLGFGVFVATAGALVGLVASIVDAQSVPGQAPAYQPGSWPATPIAPQGPMGQPFPGASPSGWGPAVLTVAEGGRSYTLPMGEGQQAVVGRGSDARIRLSDPKVSRRHVLLERSSGNWVVRDLGATNPTRLIDPSGQTQTLQGEVRISSGQLLVGDVLISLPPSR